MIRRLFAACAGLALAGCITVNLGGPGKGELVETVVEGDAGPKILLLEVSGVITAERSRGAFGLGGRPSLLSRVREQLDKAAEEEVAALVLRIDSPGGTVTASEILHGEIARFKEQTGVPVVAAFLGTAASGAYYASMAADTVVAHPTSVVGSIGVIFSGINLSGLMDKIGVENQTLTTGAFKDAGSPLRPMRDDERAQLQSVLDGLHARFVEVVIQGRERLDPGRVAELADGRVWTAPQALELGLVDAIADLHDAIGEAEARAGLEESRVVIYHRSGEYRANLYSSATLPEPTALDARAWLGVPSEPTFLYLWAPGAR